MVDRLQVPKVLIVVAQGDGHDRLGHHVAPAQDVAGADLPSHAEEQRHDAVVRRHLAVGHGRFQERELEVQEFFPVHHMSEQFDAQSLKGALDVVHG